MRDNMSSWKDVSWENVIQTLSRLGYATHTLLESFNISDCVFPDRH